MCGRTTGNPRLSQKTTSASTTSAAPATRSVVMNARLAWSGERAPDLFGGERHVEVRDTERRERVDDRVDHRRREADRPGLADSLDAERIVRRGRVRVTDLGVWNVVRAGDRVVHERTAQQMTVAIKRGVLHHHLAPALGERALELTVGEQRVHDRPGVVEPRDALRR